MAEYLEREALLRELRLWHMHKTDSLPDHFHYTGIKAWLEALPAEDVQPVVRGHWISTKEAEDMGDIMKEFTCSVCGCCEWDCTESESFNFCPNCGAYMRGVDNG